MPLRQVNFVVRNLVQQYQTWKRLRLNVDYWDREEEEENIPTAVVHLMVDDRECTEICCEGLQDSVNLWKLTAPYITELVMRSVMGCDRMVEANLSSVELVGGCAFAHCNILRTVNVPNAKLFGKICFYRCFELRHVTFRPDAEISTDQTFSYCLSLMILAASTDFEIDTGERTPTGKLDPTVGIIRYLRWRNRMDEGKVVFRTIMTLLKLCDYHNENETEEVRCEPLDGVGKFLLQHKDGGVTSHIFSFFGEKRGLGDLRNATKALLLAVGLDRNVLRREHNTHIDRVFGIRVNREGVRLQPEEYKA
eukprot:CAMPEP_0118655860 /NCGR_PEP_ID=MMETSP0785-20121206/13172_1 /TAXON_ID=91992 /ORGANISM="Bolidomonas pacifica, Strain CCMP 1866" /LENGTH=307 /DNA_ID=CAMNT_0006548663 /DNA_START=90 /DNA_END=1009 /DNA_ORIENTATION=-